MADSFMTLLYLDVSIHFARLLSSSDFSYCKLWQYFPNHNRQLDLAVTDQSNTILNGTAIQTNTVCFEE